MGDLFNDCPERSDRLRIRGRSANYLERSLIAGTSQPIASGEAKDLEEIAIVQRLH